MDHGALRIPSLPYTGSGSNFTMSSPREDKGIQPTVTAHRAMSEITIGESFRNVLIGVLKSSCYREAPKNRSETLCRASAPRRSRPRARARRRVATKIVERRREKERATDATRIRPPSGQLRMRWRFGSLSNLERNTLSTSEPESWLPAKMLL